MARYITPAVTPMNDDGSLDLQGAEKLYDYLIRGGVDGILLLGSIGEFFALSMEQKKQLMPLAIRKESSSAKPILRAISSALRNPIP